ncbi:MAG: hypothetical protein LBB40_05960 [Holophagales bacterium]|jgi:type IV secretory pathway VirB10-like protein|nr:hypothetical protein [Holophagales bacterium]
MSASQSSGKINIWLQELKSNRKTQMALGIFLLVLGYLGYELFAPSASAGSSASNKKRTSATRNIVGQPLEDAQTAALQKLPNLAGLHKAGELPSESRMFRDLFVFDSPPPPPPPPPPPQPPPPPKPPPTAAEIAAAERKAAIDKEDRAKPSTYRFIAILQGFNGPRKGAFQKGDDVDFFVVGDEVTTNWKLTVLGEEEAIFQNTKFQDLKFTIKIQLGASGQASGQNQQVTNFF